MCASLILIIIINIFPLFSLTLQCSSNNIGQNATRLFFVILLKSFIVFDAQEGQFFGKINFLFPFSFIVPKESRKLSSSIFELDDHHINAAPNIKYTGKEKVKISKLSKILETNTHKKIFYVKNAHTDTDSFIEFKNENIFHTGDVFVRYGFPFIDENNGGNIFGIIKSVDDLISRIDNTTKIIPGHGPISSKKDLILYRNNLQLIVNRIREGILNNLSVEQIIQNDPLKDINWNIDIDWNTGFNDTSLKAGENISKVYKMIKEYMNLELKK